MENRSQRPRMLLATTLATLGALAATRFYDVPTIDLANAGDYRWQRWQGRYRNGKHRGQHTGAFGGQRRG